MCLRRDSRYPMVFAKTKNSHGRRASIESTGRRSIMFTMKQKCACGSTPPTRGITREEQMPDRHTFSSPLYLTLAAAGICATTWSAPAFANYWAHCNQYNSMGSIIFSGPCFVRDNGTVACFGDGTYYAGGSSVPPCGFAVEFPPTEYCSGPSCRTTITSIISTYLTLRSSSPPPPPPPPNNDPPAPQ